MRKYSAVNKLPTTNSSKMTMMSLNSNMAYRAKWLQALHKRRRNADEKIGLPRKNNRKTAAVYLVFFMSLSLLLTLGGWQLNRGLEKSAIEKLLAHSPNQYITIDRIPPNWDALAYRRVRLEGDWLEGAPEVANAHFLLANRIHQGRLGYEVFSPFQLAADGATLLVNRGWIGADTWNENTAPDELSDKLLGELQNTLKIDQQSQIEVHGQLYLPHKGLTLGAAYHAPPAGQSQWPKVIQYFDAPALSAVFGSALQPASLALDTNHPGAFVRIWRAYSMNATRHFAYAVQWWGLAATLLVFGVIWQRQSTRTDDRNSA